MSRLLIIALGFAAAAVNAADVVQPRIVQRVVAEGPEKYYWMQSRGTLVPTNPPRMLITTQEIEKTGSHGYRDVFQLESRDGGKTWSAPRRIESLRRQTLPSGDEIVAGDLCPQWHAASKTVLAVGKTFTFRGGTREDRSAERVSYTVYDPAKDVWSELKLMDLPEADHAGRPILQPNSGCCQRFDLPDGDVLLPVRYATQPKSLRYTTIVARCRFDGRTLSYVRHGSELSIDRDRGLYEPSLTRFGGKFYLTLRADHSAFVAVSDDGLNYGPPVEWRFDDGAVLGSYNTQQHWLAHGDQLYLAYTRRGAMNDHVFRHRAPLFLAQVDAERLCVLRATEQVLVPENHADLGNFGVLEVTPRETWVITSEGLINTPRKDDRSRILAARVIW